MSIADLKHQELPLARLKKIMKLDEDVKVSSLMLKLIWCPLLMNIHPDDLRWGSSALCQGCWNVHPWALIHTEVSHLLNTPEKSSNWLDINSIYLFPDNQDLVKYFAISHFLVIQRWHQAYHQKRGIECEDGPRSGQFEKQIWSRSQNPRQMFELLEWYCICRCPTTSN